MKINAHGLQIIKQFETCRLKAYKDGGGRLTIGWGHLLVDGDPVEITQEQADALLVQDVAHAEKLIEAFVKVPLTSNQFSALVSFAYNLGNKPFAKGTVDDLLNAGKFDKVPGLMEQYVHDNGKEEKGLVRRRAVEAFLFQMPDTPEQQWAVEAGPAGAEIIQKIAQAPGSVVVLFRKAG